MALQYRATLWTSCHALAHNFGIRRLRRLLDNECEDHRGCAVGFWAHKFLKLLPKESFSNLRETYCNAYYGNCSLTSGRHAVGEFKYASIWERLHYSSFVHSTDRLILLFTHEVALPPKWPVGYRNRCCRSGSQETLKHIYVCSNNTTPRIVVSLYVHWIFIVLILTIQRNYFYTSTVHFYYI